MMRLLQNILVKSGTYPITTSFNCSNDRHTDSKVELPLALNLAKDRLEDMDISLNNIWFWGVRLVANTSNLNISKDIWKIVLLLSYYKNLGYWWPFAVGFMSLRLLVSKWEDLNKKCVKKVIFSSWDILPFSEKCQKSPNFEQVPLPNHWTYNGLWGILGKTITRSFIWYPRKWCMSNGLAVNKSWK